MGMRGGVGRAIAITITINATAITTVANGGLGTCFMCYVLCVMCVRDEGVWVRGRT